LEKEESANEERTVKAGMKIGATIGGLVFGGGDRSGFYWQLLTLILLQKIMGGTVEPTLLCRRRS
jgi:hypothetical protein